ncbi:MAG: polysaccharide pyruvyl transferase family protein [Pseudoflavonifractor sp.]|nr:polysaccharide pyruvyl transferase family protein [Pseudoflavonifractor sp.]
MDVKVITRHAPSNYGSLLQSIATVEAVESLGHSCRIIDYRRDDERGLRSILTLLAKKPEWNNNIVKKIAYVVMRWPAEKIAEVKFDSMRRRYLKMTPHVSTLDGLRSLTADIFMTGSDQVWGPVAGDRFDEAYFLTFADKGRRVAYAGSFGRTVFDDDVLGRYRDMLSRYDAIAVRENSAVDTLASMGVTTVGQVLDPTLLLDAERWSGYMPDTPPVKGEYVLVYQLHNNPALDLYATRVAGKLRLPLIRMSASMHQFARSGRFKFLPGMGKFLSLIKNARCMVTDSFHGTAFAINFNTPFVEILPGNGTGSRNQSILQLTGLQDRIVTDFDDLSIVDKAIDFDAVNRIIAREREKSMEILRTLCSPGDPDASNSSDIPNIKTA